MTLTQFLSILRARWWVALAVIGSITGATFVGSLLWPKSFTATASVVVDSRPDPIAAMAYGGGASPAFVATQMDILNSDRVAHKVVRNLRFHENAAVLQQWRDATGGQGTVEQWLGARLQHSLEVTPSRDSNVLFVAYKAPDPAFAAALANAFVQAYMETSVELRVDPARQYSSFFDARTKDAREALEKAQARLSAFQREKGIIATDERLDIENARLNELSSQLVAIQAMLSESDSRNVQARANGDRLSDVLNNPLVASLRGELSRQEVKLQELGSRLGENHPQVRELKTNIAELRLKVDLEMRRVAGSVGVTNNIMRAREAQTRAQLDAQRVKVLQLKAVRDEGQVLARDVESAQRTYEALQGRLTQTNLESQTNRASVNVLSQAAAPINPSSPNVPLYTLVSIFVGGFLAVGAVLALELLDRRLRVPADVVTALELPVIGLIPRPGSPRRAGLLRRPLLPERRLLGMPDPAKGA
jgi:chain length determinant protein EpsF